MQIYRFRIECLARATMQNRRYVSYFQNRHLRFVRITRTKLNRNLFTGVTTPTDIQSNCIPKIIEGSDCIGCAKTGSGKTLAFALPILQKLSDDPYGIFALILTPTRELAYQVRINFKMGVFNLTRVLNKRTNTRICISDQRSIFRFGQ